MTVPSGEGSPRGGQGDDDLTKGGGGQTAAIQLHGPLLDTPTHGCLPTGLIDQGLG